MGGIGTLPMDYGQSLQVPQQQQPSFSSAQNITSNPLLNYGQPQLGQAGGTPLTMRSGGRIGYQEGGITMTQFGAPQEEPIFPRLETLNENLGQAEQRLGSPSNNQFNISPMTSAFTGRSQMNLGGRIGYQEGGMDQMMQPQMQDPMMQQPMQPQQMMEPPLQGMEGQQPDIKDPQQALEIIIQMLVAQGIPPEQAREIALQMVQAVAEGGMGEMEDQRVEARFGGRIGYAGGGLTSIDRARDMLQSRAPSGEFLAYINPQEAGILKLMGGAGEDVNVKGVPSFFIKSIGKAIGSVAKGVTSAVKSVVKSPIGKAALAAAAIYFTGGGAAFGGPGFGSAGTLFGPGGALGGATGLFGAAPIAGTMGPSSAGLFGVGGSFAPFSGSLLSSVFSPSGIARSLGTNALTSLAGGFLGGSLSGGVPEKQPGELDADYQNRVNQYKAQYAPLLNPTVQYPNNPFYPPAQMAANGGRIGYQEGGIGNLISQVTKQEFFGTPMMANGGRMGYELGSEVPVRKNQAGVKELDYRDTGGFVPPIGIKERADDIPAMLSNNEFVFTADAVRNAGGGDENLGAKRMYTLMKNLESGGSV
jgi:hypothetical protein